MTGASGKLCPAKDAEMSGNECHDMLVVPDMPPLKLYGHEKRARFARAPPHSSDLEPLL